jgi:hypothetical protein
MAAQDRRRRAALIYGVSVERFRKHHERIVLEQVAEEILSVLCKSSRYAKDPLWLLSADLHRPLAQAQKACTRGRFCITL